MAQRLLLIRHAQTAHNAQNRYLGWIDPPLDATGWQQAEALAKHLRSRYRLDRLYASPLLRAQQTAAVIASASGLSVQTEPNLKELCFGDVEGLTLEEARQCFPQLLTAWEAVGDITFAYPGGERLVDFFWRIRQAILATLAKPEGTLAVVTHGGVIATYLAHAIDNSPLRWLEYRVDNASITELEIKGRRSRLVRLNDTSFLPEAGGVVVPHPHLAEPSSPSRPFHWRQGSGQHSEQRPQRSG